MSIYISQNTNLLTHRIYRFLESFPLTQNYIKKLSYRYRLISPCDSKTISKKTVASCLVSWSLSLFTFILMFLSHRRLINLIISGVAILIINAEVVSRMANKYRINLLIETQKMLSEVVHYFYVEYRIDDGIYRAREHLSPDMKVVVDQIYLLLLSGNREESLREYYDNIPNKYLRTFVSQCVGLMEYGDQLIDEKSLFVRNMENLQREIEIEIDKLQRLNMEFMGVILCVISPIFCIELVKKFAISLKINMVDFYYGQEGFLLDIFLLLVIVCIYVIMRKSAEYTPFHQSSHKWLYRIDEIGFVKRAMNNYCEKNASKQERLQRKLRNSGANIRARHFVLRSFLIAMSVFFLSMGITVYIHIFSKRQLLIVKPHEVEMLMTMAKESQYESMIGTIESYTKNYLDKPGSTSLDKEQIKKEFKKDGVIYNHQVADALAGDILRRLNKYDYHQIRFLNILICLLISLTAYYLPDLILKYSSSVSRDVMEDEVNQFNALIGMLMHNETMTVKRILQEMESFAVVFKQSLRTCINDYSSGDLESLNELKEREPYEPFRRIVDNLIRCDDMPISQAFNEINIEMDGYMAKRRLANEKSIKKRVFRAYALAALPFLLLFAYGIMPVLVSSVNEINQLLDELKHTVQ